MTDQPYTNSFADVHSKIKALKERTAAATKDDRELRESRLVREATDILDHEAK